MIQHTTTIYVDDVRPEFVAVLCPDIGSSEQGVTIRLQSVHLTDRPAQAVTVFGTIADLETFAALFHEAVIDARQAMHDQPRMTTR